MARVRSQQGEQLPAGSQTAATAGSAQPAQPGLPTTTAGRNLLKPIGIGVAVVVLSALLVAALPLVKSWLSPGAQTAGPDQNNGSSVRLVAGQPNTIEVAPETVQTLRVRTVKVDPATALQPLEMGGQLAPNLDHLVRIKLFFAGQVETIPEIQTVAPDASGRLRTTFQQLGLGDKVEKGQVLAVIFSKDFGQAKSDLVDGVSKLTVDRDYLAMVKKNENSLPVKTVMDAQRMLDADQIAVQKAERTLRSWGISDEEIEALKAEARKGGITDKDQYKKWARYEVKAPFAGTIVEKNATQGENVDPSTSPPLFQLADFSKMSVFAFPFEEDLPALQSLPKPVQWTIRLKANPKAKPLTGTINTIGAVIDPNMRTALVTGQVDNPEGLLLAGQYVTATVETPPPRGQVEIPTNALVEDGEESIVFVQPDPEKLVYVMKRIAVARRGEQTVYVRSNLTDEQKRRGLQPLQPGELVVISGALQLRAALQEQQGAAKK